MGNRFPHTDSDVYFFADNARRCEVLLKAGARVIQFRNKQMDDTSFGSEARGILQMVRSIPGAVMVVNDRVEVALEIGADGVHVGQEDRSCASILREAPPDFIVGVSVRTPKDALGARAEGASYIGAGSVFPSPTRPDAAVIGPEGLRLICSEARIPVVALGGITEGNLNLVTDTGARYFGMISALLGLNDCLPATVCRIRAAL